MLPVWCSMIQSASMFLNTLCQRVNIGRLMNLCEGVFKKSRQNQLITGLSKGAFGEEHNISGGFHCSIYGVGIGETFQKIGK